MKVLAHPTYPVCEKDPDRWLSELSTVQKVRHNIDFLEKQEGEICQISHWWHSTRFWEVRKSRHLIDEIPIAIQTEIGFPERPQKLSSKSQEKRKRLIRAKQKFDELLPRLLKEHKNKYVAIVEDNVEIGTDKNTLLERVVKKHGYVSMYFDKISDNRKIIKLSSRPKLAGNDSP